MQWMTGELRHTSLSDGHGRILRTAGPQPICLINEQVDITLTVGNSKQSISCGVN